MQNPPIPQHSPTPSPPITPSVSLETLRASSFKISHEAALLELIQRTLEDKVASIEAPYFTCPSLQLLEIAPAFGRIREPKLLAYAAKDIFQFAVTSQERARLVARSLPYLLRSCSVENKRMLLDLSLQQEPKTLRRRLAYGVIRSAKTLDELHRLLSFGRSEKLVRLDSKKLTELVARIEVLRTLRTISSPPPMWDNKFAQNTSVNRGIARARIRQLGQAAQAGLHSLSKLTHLMYPHEKQGALKTTPRPLSEALTTLSLVARRVEKIQQGPAQTYGRLREFVNIHSRRLSLECQEGIRVLQSHKLPTKDLWTPKRVQKLLEAYRMIPESERIMTPNLREFIFSKIDHYGERRHSGRIALGYPAALSTRKRALYDGAAMMTVVTIHEVAHSIQMGREGAFANWDVNSGHLTSPNNPLINFKGFLDISGWRVVGIYNAKDLVSGNAIKLFDQIYPLDRPVLAEVPYENSETETKLPRWVIFRRNDNLVYYHDADAQFSLNNNATRDPSEDWAESFCEYILCPDRLIQQTPKKFHYMEIHFGLYRENRDYSRLVALRRKLKTLSTGRESSLGNILPPPIPPRLKNNSETLQQEPDYSI